MHYDSTLVMEDVSAAPPPLASDGPVRIAPLWHTLALLALFACTTYLTSHRAAGEQHLHVLRARSYITSIAMEWLLLGLVIAGIYRRRAFLRGAFLNRAYAWSSALGYGLMTYGLGFMAILCVGSVLYFTPLFHERNEAVILAMAPHTVLEFVLWFFVSLTAGVSEELIFRGYLQQQITALTRRPILSIVLAAGLFGSVHLYEGVAAMIPLAALAMVYGLVVRYFKGDLRAVIVAHTLQDFVVAFLILVRPYLEHYRLKV